MKNLVKALMLLIALSVNLSTHAQAAKRDNAKARADLLKEKREEWKREEGGRPEDIAPEPEEETPSRKK